MTPFRFQTAQKNSAFVSAKKLLNNTLLAKLRSMYGTTKISLIYPKYLFKTLKRAIFALGMKTPT